jgi:hypothetical protein
MYHPKPLPLACHGVSYFRTAKSKIMTTLGDLALLDSKQRERAEAFSRLVLTTVLASKDEVNRLKEAIKLQKGKEKTRINPTIWFGSKTCWRLREQYKIYRLLFYFSIFSLLHV